MKRAIVAIILGLAFSFPAYSDHHETDGKSMDMASDKMKDGKMHGKHGKKHGKRWKMMKKRVHKKCQSDIESHCKDVEKGEGRVMKCLRENDGKLSDGCKKAMKKMHDKKKKWKEKRGKRKGKGKGKGKGMGSDHGKMHDGDKDM